MATWTTFADEAPDMAALAERRFTATGLALIATLRADGSPRISPLEPMVEAEKLVLHDGCMVLGMMPGSTKARDLQRDPRMSLHAATVDKMLSEPDVKLWGRGVELTDDAGLRDLAELHERVTGYKLEPGGFHIFLPDIEGVAVARIGDKAFYVDSWKPGEPVRSRKVDG